MVVTPPSALCFVRMVERAAGPLLVPQARVPPRDSTVTELPVVVTMLPVALRGLVFPVVVQVVTEETVTALAVLMGKLVARESQVQPVGAQAEARAVAPRRTEVGGQTAPMMITSRRALGAVAVEVAQMTLRIPVVMAG